MIFFGIDIKEFLLRSAKIAACCVICTLCVRNAHLNAQPVSVNAFTDKNKILLGEPFWLTLEARGINATSLPKFNVDSIAHFEIISKDSISSTKSGDTLIVKQYYKLLSFDSGQWVIPPFLLRPFVKTNSILIDVVYTEGFDPNQAYHDVQKIKGIPFAIDVNVERWWYPTALMLILLTLIIYWLTQEKKIKLKDRHSHNSAYKTAMQQLVALKKSDAECKKLYAELVEIFRTYVFERTGVLTMQETSVSLAEKMKPIFKENVKYDQLSNVLHLCDFVKFAKYRPEKNETTQAFETIESAITYIEHATIKNVNQG